jgi:hypothetical protein
MKFKVGDKVKINDQYDPWHGQIVEIKLVDPGPYDYLTCTLDGKTDA